MRTVVFVGPFFTAKTIRYVHRLTELSGVRAAVISSDPLRKLPGDLTSRLSGFCRVGNCLDGEELARALREISDQAGPVERLFGALEQLQMPLAVARDRAGVPGMGAKVARRFRDKSAMKEALRAGQVPCARYVRVTHPDDARGFVNDVGFPVIIKPVDGLGTRSTWRLESAEALEQALHALSPCEERPLQCEEFLQGTEHSFETVTIDGEPVWSSSTNYIPGPLEVMNTPWIQYCVVLPRETEVMEEFREVNRSALKTLGMGTGISHMEWFRRPDGSVAVNEVGARPPGVNIMPLMSAAHEVDFFGAWIRLMALDEFDPPERRYAAGSAFLRGQGHGQRVVAVDGLEEVLRDLGDAVVSVVRPRVGQPRATGYEGEGYVILRGSTTEEVMRGLARVIRTVRVVLG